LTNNFGASDAGPSSPAEDRGAPDLERQPEKSSVVDTLIFLSARKRLIMTTTIAGGLLATALAFIIPPIYTATSIIMPPQQQSSAAAALLGSLQLGNVAGLASQGLGIKNPADPYVGILNSRTIADELISKFGLKEVYDKKYLVDVRKKLANRTSISSAKYSLIQISVEDRDRKRAADLANAYVDCLQEQNSRLAVTESSQRRLFFERQLEAEKKKLAEAENAFRSMQEQKGIYQVSSQVEAVIRAMAQMRAEITAREVNLQRLKAGATTQNPEVLRQEIELTALHKQLKELEASSANKNPGDPLIPTTMVPEAGLEYARRLREVKYRETLFELLAKQYEAARIDEAKQAPIIQVVDQAIPPDKRTSPKRSAIVILGVILGALAGIGTAYMKRAGQDPRHAEKLTALRKQLWSSGKSID
jgi:tyrosine-protein kinase Etk/Wzc